MGYSYIVEIRKSAGFNFCSQNTNDLFLKYEWQIKVKGSPIALFSKRSRDKKLKMKKTHMFYQKCQSSHSDVPYMRRPVRIIKVKSSTMAYQEKKLVLLRAKSNSLPNLKICKSHAFLTGSNPIADFHASCSYQILETIFAKIKSQEEVKSTYLTNFSVLHKQTKTQITFHFSTSGTAI